eukprot:116402-Chlamydomonas_euryale.AAC.1
MSVDTQGSHTSTSCMKECGHSRQPHSYRHEGVWLSCPRHISSLLQAHTFSKPTLFQAHTCASKCSMSGPSIDPSCSKYALKSSRSSRTFTSKGGGGCGSVAVVVVMMCGGGWSWWMVLICFGGGGDVYVSLLHQMRTARRLRRTARGVYG